MITLKSISLFSDDLSSHLFISDFFAYAKNNDDICKLDDYYKFEYETHNGIISRSHLLFRC